MLQMRAMRWLENSSSQTGHDGKHDGNMTFLFVWCVNLRLQSPHRCTMIWCFHLFLISSGELKPQWMFRSNASWTSWFASTVNCTNFSTFIFFFNLQHFYCFFPCKLNRNAPCVLLKSWRISRFQCIMWLLTATRILANHLTTNSEYTQTSN